MSCHDIGRGMSAVSKTVLDLYEEKQISKESTMKLILACKNRVIAEYKAKMKPLAEKSD